MAVAIITGSAGLIGSEAATYFAQLGYDVVGIDNDMRRSFFGDDASTRWNRERLISLLGKRYSHYDADIRDSSALEGIVGHYGSSIELIIHTAAQPSHDWAANAPQVDFAVNANGTLNMLELARRYAPAAPFVFTSTNKVYGDAPNRLPLVEQATRWEIDPTHRYANGVREDMPIDQALHSLFGGSKLAADVMVQEYGRYFGLPTVSFRGGCSTGPTHSATKLHGFLAYLVKCTAVGDQYTILGYRGKQVRDNIHSADLISAFHEFVKAPRCGEVYNIGGGRFSNCSILEAIELAEETCGLRLSHTYLDTNRIGDHVWWISDNSKFTSHYPAWTQRHAVREIIQEIHDDNIERWTSERRYGDHPRAANGKARDAIRLASVRE